MSTVTRDAGVNGSFPYTTDAVPFDRPYVTIFSDAGRTTVAVARVQTAATGASNVFTVSYPATLAAGTYYLTFDTVFTSGQPATIDNNDELVLRAVGGSVTGTYA